MKKNNKGTNERERTNERTNKNRYRRKKDNIYQNTNILISPHKASIKSNRTNRLTKRQRQKGERESGSISTMRVCAGQRCRSEGYMDYCMRDLVTHGEIPGI